MVRKGILAVFESSNIFKSEETTPTKISVHALDIRAYMHEFFSRFQLIKFFDDHGLYLAIFESSNISKTGEATPTKIGVLTPIPTYMNFLSRFRMIKFFDDHGL